MGETIRLTAKDGHELDAYKATPQGQPKGCVVVVQEIFGVNGYIRSVADGFAEQGYLALAPALFDRTAKGVELGYEGDDMQKAFGLMQKLTPETALMDVAAAFFELKKAERGVAVVGFCYGGFMAWQSATTPAEDLAMRPDCTVCYYPGGIGKVAENEVFCPVMIHIGTSDSHIGSEQIDAVRKAHPEVEVYEYEGAEHGFACWARGAFKEDAAKLANQRTEAFLATHLA